MPETMRFDASPAAASPAPKERYAALLIVQGHELDLGTHVVCENSVVLGRDPDVELALQDGSISRAHCRVEREAGGGYVLRDQGSMNGTRLNGVLIDGPVPLSEGDKIFLGATVVKFGYADRLDMAYHQKLDALVRTDALTGLVSKRQFDAELVLAVERARSLEQALSMLVMDMDGLKQINDTYGHHVGGFAITEVAQITRAVLGDQGQACRFGGDEFAAFLPSVPKDAARRLAQALVDRVAAHRLQSDEVTVAVTLSIGVASHPEDGQAPEELFRAADRALYRAKAAGKNQVSC